MYVRQGVKQMRNIAAFEKIKNIGFGSPMFLQNIYCFSYVQPSS
ncbi:hypothetical protein MUS_1143 [Bacillus velezensis YAU B9601-Y2]|uniref:Uncharacterized protein n=1 Tax=Bacillus amyloliquefaciens (strain Y2) TaxID=1155777 RepID=I2C3E8_BACAY|nr:hypothetical protein MUS_1143 [Bacillus velezensis YAU B9601-Y2]